MPRKLSLETGKKALIVASSSKIRAAVNYILSDYIKCVFIKSSPDAKIFLKSTEGVRVLVLDWAIQDKYGSIMKCLKEAKSRKNILVVNVFISKSQKKSVYSSLPNLAHNNKVYSVVSDFIELPLLLVLIKLRKRIYAHK